VNSDGVIIQHGDLTNVTGSIYFNCDFCFDETDVHIVDYEGTPILLCTNCAIEILDSKVEMNKLKKEKCKKRKHPELSPSQEDLTMPDSTSL
jgi:ribosome-binding protein aMBF1 (putative translation factor)